MSHAASQLGISKASASMQDVVGGEVGLPKQIDLLMEEEEKLEISDEESMQVKNEGIEVV